MSLQTNGRESSKRTDFGRHERFPSLLQGQRCSLQIQVRFGKRVCNNEVFPRSRPRRCGIQNNKPLTKEVAFPLFSNHTRVCSAKNNSSLFQSTKSPPRRGTLYILNFTCLTLKISCILPMRQRTIVPNHRDDV